jgi:hypothetical protein
MRVSGKDVSVFFLRWSESGAVGVALTWIPIVSKLCSLPYTSE